MSGVMSSVEAGIGIAIGAEAFGYSFGNRVKLLRLTPEPKPFPSASPRQRDDLVQRPRNFGNARKKLRHQA